jgi:ABC-type polysaccharide/polyol phosphate transport system ATPase subunit
MEAENKNENRIIVENISKKFKIGFKKNQGALERFISFFSGKEPKKTIHALKDVSFEVRKGEIVGIIGENGSGKSTLLRVIAGIYKQDEGKIITNGKVISIINLVIGLHLRLTMKDNILLISSFFGLSQKEIEKRFDSIVEFAELESFVNTKIYQFSEGMKQRLAFSIAIYCNPEILLLDEVFEVGDESFRKKSTEIKPKGLNACYSKVSYN